MTPIDGLIAVAGGGAAVALNDNGGGPMPAGMCFFFGVVEIE